jgi:pimeloyl-ACP methyl ester carboxylesterase
MEGHVPGPVPIYVYIYVYVDLVGQGDPLVLMHGGPSADLWTMGALRRCADQFTLVFYDQGCNGRSVGSRFVDDMGKPHRGRRGTARASGFLRSGRCLGTRSAAAWPLSTLRYPDRVSHLVLLGTGGDSRGSGNAPELLAQRGYT